MFGETQFLFYNNGIAILKMKDDLNHAIAACVLPYILNGSECLDVYFDPDQIPLVHIASIPNTCKKEKVINYISETRPIVKYYVYEKESSYSIDILFASNEDAYTVIDECCYSEINEKEIIMTHYKCKKQIDLIRRNEICVCFKGEKKSVDICSDFSQFGRVRSVNVSNSRAYIEFENPKDVYKALEAIKGGKMEYMKPFFCHRAK